MDRERFEGYDIVGDVHGCAHTLVQLLEKLGYSKRSGVYSHPKRQMIFVGDVVDRGPRIRQSLDIVYGMVDAGHAQMVMGNHEYHVYCYATEDPRAKGTEPTRYLRERNDRNSRMVAETFEQFANYRHDFRAYLDWISELPLFLEMPNFRVVHACWDNQLIQAYREKYNHNRVSPQIILKSTNPASLEARTLDRLTRGISLALPEGRVIHSQDGFTRRYFRAKFWADKPRTYGDVVFQPDPLPEYLLQRPLDSTERRRLVHYPSHEKPVFFGHYWLQGHPRPVKHNICCLDYSAVKFGRLVTYRIDREQWLDPDNYIWLYVDLAEQKS